MKQQYRTARHLRAGVTGRYNGVSLRTRSVLWRFHHLLFIVFVATCLMADSGLPPSNTYASGSNDFIRNVSKEIIPESDPPFTIGEITSMVTGSDGSIYAGSGTTIYKLSSSGVYIKQWEANGTIGILNFGSDTGLLYKTGDNGIQSFTTEGVETGTISVSGSLVRGKGPNKKWYGVGEWGSSPVTELSSVTSDTLFVYSSGGDLINSYNLATTAEYPSGISVLSLSSTYNEGVYGRDMLYLGTSGKVLRLGAYGNITQSWEDGTGTTQYDSVTADSKGNVYASDGTHNTIRKFDKDLQPLMEWGSLGAGDLEFDDPGEIAVSSSNNIYIDDLGNSRVKQYEDSTSISITSPSKILDYIRPNTPFSFTVQTNNTADDLSFSAVNANGNTVDLPLGLSLNTSTGEISGTLDNSIDITNFQEFFLVKVISSNGSYSEKEFELRGADLSEPVNIETTTLPDMSFGMYLDGKGGYSLYPSIEVSGGQEFGLYPLTFSIVDGELPRGVEIWPTGTAPSNSVLFRDVNDGVLVGEPIESGIYTFTVRVESTDPLLSSSDEHEYTIEVTAPPTPNPFNNDSGSVSLPILKVSSVVAKESGTVVSGEGPADQDIKIYMDNTQIGTTNSGADGKWSYEAGGLNGAGHNFSAAWDAEHDIAFLLGSDSPDILFSSPNPYSSIQVFDTVTGKTLKNLVMPEGFYAIQLVPNSDGTKLYLSGLDVGNMIADPTAYYNSARVLEYDVASGSLSFVTDITESLDSISSLLLNSDGSVLYVLTSSGLYSIDTTNHETELVSVLEDGVYRFGGTMESIEFNEDESKIFIADIQYPYVVGSTGWIYKKRVLSVDLASKSASIEEVPVYVEGAGYSYFYGQAFIARGNGNIYLAYRDGSVKVVDGNGNIVDTFSFNLSQGDGEDTIIQDEPAGYIYESSENALYLLLYTHNNDTNENVYSLRKLDLQNGTVSATYTLPFLPRLGLFSQDKRGLYLFDSLMSSLNTGVYRLDLDTGNIETVTENIASLPLAVADGGAITSNPFFVASSRSVVSGFGVTSNSVLVEKTTEEDKPVDDKKPVDDPKPDNKDVDKRVEEPQVDTPVIPPVGSVDKPGTTYLNSKKESSGLVRDLVDRLASMLGVEPIVVAKVFPWTVVGALFGLIFIVLVGLIKQLIVVAKMKKLVRKQELLNLEKTWLLSLSSHYLRTPLTIIQSGQEMLKKGAYKNKLVNGMSSLSLAVGKVINDLRNNSVVAEMKAPEKKRYRHASFWQFKVVVPALVAVGLLVGLNLIFTFGADLYPGTVSIISQLCFVLVGASLLYVIYDTLAERKALERYQKQLLVYEEELDKVRNKFVLSMAKELMPEIKKAKSFVTVKTPINARRNLNKGLEQLEKTTDKFLLICQLEREELKKQAAELGLKGTVEKAREQSKHPDSPVNVLLSEDSTLSQPEVLLKKVFASLIDNAAEHSNSKRPVKIYSDEGKMVKVSVEDFGKGIDKDKLTLLFKPLSKVEEDFTSQGMGLSLYLNRLIMHYLNGEISATSKLGEGTTMIVEVPRVLS